MVDQVPRMRSDGKPQKLKTTEPFNSANWRRPLCRKQRKISESEPSEQRLKHQDKFMWLPTVVEVDINQKFLVCGFILRLKKNPLDLLCAPKTYIESDLLQDISQGLTQKLAKAPHSFAVTFLRVGN